MRADSLGALPGETSAMRVEEESAEAIVAKKRGKTARSEGPKDHETDHSDNLYGLAKSRLKRTEAVPRPAGDGQPGRWGSKRPVDSGRRSPRRGRARPQADEEARRC